MTHRSHEKGVVQGTPHSGFTLVEVLVAIMVTMIVMGVVFALLSTSVETSGREHERAQIQANARKAVETLQSDILQVGSDLPPEFPSLRSYDAAGITARSGRPPGTDFIEIVGNFSTDATGGGPTEMESFDGYRVRLKHGPSVPFSEGDLVVIFDDKPIAGNWVFALVNAVYDGSPPELDVLTAPGSMKMTPGGTNKLPANVSSAYNRIVTGFPESGFITQVSVVSYELRGPAGAVSSTGASIGGQAQERVLTRRVNWGESIEVARVADLEVQYFVGGTVNVPPSARDRGGSRLFMKRGDPLPPPPILGSKTVSGGGGGKNSSGRSRRSDGADAPTFPSVLNESLVDEAPVPQPDPNSRSSESVLGVKISITVSSFSGRLGSSENGLYSYTHSTRVATRNLVDQAQRRVLEALMMDRSSPNKKK